MGNPYAAKIVDSDNVTRLAGDVTFTDAANQPGGDPTPPVTIEGTDDVVQLTVKADAGQTADVVEVTDSTGSRLALIAANGSLQLGADTGGAGLYVDHSASALAFPIGSIAVKDTQTSPRFTVTDGTAEVTVQGRSNLTITPHASATRAFEVFTPAGATIFQVDPDSKIGFYGHATVAQQTGVAVTAAAIHAALVNLGLITA